MNIGISLSGEGHGHAARITALVKRLEADHHITLWAPPTVHDFLRKYFPDNEILEAPFMRFVKKNHRIKILSTAFANLGNALKRFFPDKFYVQQLIDRKINLFIADYEPALPVAAGSIGIPVVIFNHQSIIYRHPAFSFLGIITFIVNNLMIPPSDKVICSSFYDGDVGPLLRDEIVQQDMEPGDHILVYASKSIKGVLLPILEKHPGIKFDIFPNSGKDFTKSLLSCKAAVGPAGHQFISECLYLKKPLLVFPQANQYEQQLNARMVERSGWGLAGRLNRMDEDIARFLLLTGDFPLHPGDSKIRFDVSDNSVRSAYLVNAFINEQFIHGKSKPRRPLPAYKLCQ